MSRIATLIKEYMDLRDKAAEQFTMTNSDVVASGLIPCFKVFVENKGGLTDKKAKAKEGRAKAKADLSLPMGARIKRIAIGELALMLNMVKEQKQEMDDLLSMEEMDQEMDEAHGGW